VQIIAIHAFHSISFIGKQNGEVNVSNNFN